MTKGDLQELLKYIKTDNELRLEVRQSGDAFVYYRKGIALEIKGLKVDKKYGEVPPTNLAISNPSEYFKLMKITIDKWLPNNKKRAEFDTQQKIAQCNQGKEDKYIILDMEYAFEQNQIQKNRREKRGVFDLLGIEQKTNKIIFFEVKKGMGATKGKSGVEEHINDFKTYLFGRNSELFRVNLTNDIKNIIEDKIKLGLLNSLNIPDNIDHSSFELVFVFHPDNESQIADFKRELKDQYKLIIVKDNEYKLT